MVIGESTPETGASPAPPGVLYTVSVLWTALGLFMREDECGTALLPGAGNTLVQAPTVRRTGWQMFVSEKAYDNYWRRRFTQQNGDPYLRTDDDWPNLLVAWVMPFSQLSDHEGYTGDNH